MRWDSQRLAGRSGTDADQPAELALFGLDACARTFDTPEFRGMTFYEIHARSLLNKVPSAARVPFDWTITPTEAVGMPVSTASPGAPTSTSTSTPDATSTPR